MSQQLRLSPQLQQSLHILQVPVQELQQLVRQEMVENPVLELESTEISLDEQSPEASANDDGFDEEFSRLSEMDDEWRNYLSQSAGATKAPRTAEEEERRQFLFDSITSPVTLQEHLAEQLRLVDCTEEEKKLVDYLTGVLDDRGYLQPSLGELSLQMSLPLDQLKAAHKILLSFDPPGIGAENLAQCLLVQLERDGREHSLEARIITHHIDDLAHRRFAHIAKKLAVPPAAVAKATESIAALNPRPAANFTSAPSQYISPDVTVEPNNGGYQIALQDEQVPRLRISNLYKDLMGEGRGAEVRDYIKQKIQSGKFLIRSIQQRQETIRKIAEQILQRQMDFMRHGPSHLRPMTMSQVADVVGVHETTVSRAVNGKYISTPQGVFEMKYFFTTGYEFGGGEQMSKTGVKTALAEIVKAESPGAPLTDDQIQSELEKRGIKIARRTVAKYRDALGILPVNLRRGA